MNHHQKSNFELTKIMKILFQFGKYKLNLEVVDAAGGTNYAFSQLFHLSAKDVMISAFMFVFNTFKGCLFFLLTVVLVIEFRKHKNVEKLMSWRSCADRVHVR